VAETELTDEMPNTNALRYSLMERLHFKLFGRWPERVIDRRLAALAADERRRYTK